MGTKYNLEGVNGRNCPRCFRPGTLTGSRTHGCTMECTSCAAEFRLDRNDPVGPTLEHITYEDRWNIGARLADASRCGTCGLRACGCGPQHQAEQREYRTR